MTDFGIQVKIDPGDAKPTIKSLTDAVELLEKQARDASGRFVSGMKEGSLAADQAKAALDRNSDGLTRNQRAQQDLINAVANRERLAEEDMYKRIMGPLDEYTEKLGALERLLEKDKISTSQYAEQVVRLNAALEKTSTIKETNVKFGPDASQRGTPAGPMFGPDRNQAGPSGAASGGDTDMFGGTAAMVAGLATIATVKTLATEVVALSDRYVEASNQALRLTDSTHGVDQVLTEQIGLSERLHGSLADTIRLTALARAGQEAMNYTTQETKDLVTDVAAKVELGGGSLSDAATMMKKLQYAFEEGIVPGRSLKQIFQDYPAVSKTMQEELGVTEQRLTQLGKEGKITGEMLRDGFRLSSDEEAKFSKMTETTGQQWDHFKDKLAVGLGTVDWSSGMSNLASFGEMLTGTRSRVVDLQTTLGNAEAWNKVGDFFKDLTERAEKLGNATENIRMAPGVQQIFDNYDHQGDQVKNLTEAIRINEAEQEKLHHTQLGGIIVEGQLSAAMEQHTKFERDLEALTRKHTGTLKQHHVVLSEEEKIIQGILKADREHNEGIAATQKLYDEGRISLDNYNKSIEHYNAINGTKPVNWRNALGPITGALGAVGASGAAFEKSGEEAQKEHAKDLTSEGALYKALREPMLKYQDDLDKINDLRAKGAMSDEHYASDLEGLKAKYLGITNDQAEYLRGVQEIDKATKDLGLTTAEHAQVLDNWNKKTGQARDVAMGFSDGLKSIEKEMGTGGATAAAKLLTDGFNGVNSALTELITTGTTDWSKFVKTLEADAVNFALKDLEGGLMGALKGGGKGGGQAAAVTAAMTTGGSTAGETISAAMVAAGSEVAAEIAAAMATRSAPGAFLPGVPGGASEAASGVSDAGIAAAGGAVGAATESYHLPSAPSHTGGVTVVVQNARDDRALMSTLRSKNGARAVAAHVRENPRAFQSLLGKR